MSRSYRVTNGERSVAAMQAPPGNHLYNSSARRGVPERAALRFRKHAEYPSARAGAARRDGRFLRSKLVLVSAVLCGCGLTSGWFLYGWLRSRDYDTQFEPLSFFLSFVLFVLLAALGVTLPMVMLAMIAREYVQLHRPRGRAARGLCWNCGFPASDQAVCPECGRDREISAQRIDRRAALIAAAVWLIALVVGSAVAEAQLLAEDRAFARFAEAEHETSTATARRTRPWPWRGFSLGKMPGQPVFVND